VSSRALVLSGGGLTGVAWLTGLLARLEAEGVALHDADLVLGTSAGAVAGAQVVGGRDLQRQYRWLTGERVRTRSLMIRAFDRMPKPAPTALGELHARWLAAPVSSEITRQDTGRLALGAKTMPERAFVALLAAYLRMRRWPGAALAVATVDVESGRERLWRAGDGAHVARTIAASCAVPAVFPTVRIGGRRYMDGGARSVTNADLAAGHDVVVVLLDYTPTDGVGPTSRTAIDLEIAGLRAAGSTVIEIGLDAASLEAMGPLIFDPSRLKASAEAGWNQGAAELARVRDAWRASTIR
jgi:NTE family protein